MSMMSLNPGPLFQSPGFNRTYTPLGPSASASDFKEIYAREQFSERYDWPPESPVAEVYDISNTSEKMILLNNRSKPRSAGHLRGQTDRVNSRTRTPDPDRHTPDIAPRKNQDRHQTCADSSSPRFERKPKMSQMWVNQSARPAWKPENDKEQHMSCRASSCSSPYSFNQAHFNARPPRCGIPKHRRRPPISMGDNRSLLGSGLSKGDQTYLWDIAKVYDVSREKRYKQYQYRALVFKEVLRGFHTMEECQKYLRYIDGPRQRQYGISDPNGSSKTPRPVRSRIDHGQRSRSPDKAGSKSKKREKTPIDKKESTKNQHSKEKETDSDKDGSVHQDPDTAPKENKKEQDRTEDKSDPGHKTGASKRDKKKDERSQSAYERKRTPKKTKDKDPSAPDAKKKSSQDKDKDHPRDTEKNRDEPKNKPKKKEEKAREKHNERENEANESELALSKSANRKTKSKTSPSDNPKNDDKNDQTRCEDQSSQPETQRHRKQDSHKEKKHKRQRKDEKDTQKDGKEEKTTIVSSSVQTHETEKTQTEQQMETGVVVEQIDDEHDNDEAQTAKEKDSDLIVEQIQTEKSEESQPTNQTESIQDKESIVSDNESIQSHSKSDDAIDEELDRKNNNTFDDESDQDDTLAEEEYPPKKQLPPVDIESTSANENQLLDDNHLSEDRSTAQNPDEELDNGDSNFQCGKESPAIERNPETLDKDEKEDNVLSRDPPDEQSIHMDINTKSDDWENSSNSGEESRDINDKYILSGDDETSEKVSLEEQQILQNGEHSSDTEPHRSSDSEEKESEDKIVLRSSQAAEEVFIGSGDDQEPSSDDGMMEEHKRKDVEILSDSNSGSDLNGTDDAAAEYHSHGEGTLRPKSRLGNRPATKAVEMPENVTSYESSGSLEKQDEPDKLSNPVHEVVDTDNQINMKSDVHSCEEHTSDHELDDTKALHRTDRGDIELDSKSETPDIEMDDSTEKQKVDEMNANTDDGVDKKMDINIASYEEIDSHEKDKVPDEDEGTIQEDESDNSTPHQTDILDHPKNDLNAEMQNEDHKEEPLAESEYITIDPGYIADEENGKQEKDKSDEDESESDDEENFKSGDIGNHKDSSSVDSGKKINNISTKDDSMQGDSDIDHDSDNDTHMHEDSNKKDDDTTQKGQSVVTPDFAEKKEIHIDANEKDRLSIVHNDSENTKNFIESPDAHKQDIDLADKDNGNDEDQTISKGNSDDTNMKALEEGSIYDITKRPETRLSISPFSSTSSFSSSDSDSASSQIQNTQSRV